MFFPTRISLDFAHLNVLRGGGRQTEPGKIVILHSTTGKRTHEFHTTLEVNTLVKPLWFPPCFSLPLVYFIFAFMFKMEVRVDHRMQTADAGSASGCLTAAQLQHGEAGKVHKSLHCHPLMNSEKNSQTNRLQENGDLKGL